MVLVQTETCSGHAKASNDIELKLCCTENTNCNINQHYWTVQVKTAHSNIPQCSEGFIVTNASCTVCFFCVLVQKGQCCGLCYVWGHIILVTVYRQGVRNKLFGTERYSLRYKLCNKTCTVCITNRTTEQVQSGLQTVLQNMYSLHYKLCYRTGTVCITNCATEQVQSALQTVL